MFLVCFLLLVLAAIPSFIYTVQYVFDFIYEAEPGRGEMLLLTMHFMLSLFFCLYSIVCFFKLFLS